jgi:hypothetical protein
MAALHRRLRRASLKVCIGDDLWRRPSSGVEALKDPRSDMDERTTSLGLFNFAEAYRLIQL